MAKKKVIMIFAGCFLRRQIKNQKCLNQSRNKFSVLSVEYLRAKFSGLFRIIKTSVSKTKFKDTERNTDGVKLAGQY